MIFYGYHGVFPEENKLGQRFVVDLIIELDLQKAGQTDNLDDTVNYAELYKICRDIVEKKTFRLVETIAETIAAKILHDLEKVLACTVKVIKPDPPIPGNYQSVAVQIKRSR